MKLLRIDMTEERGVFQEIPQEYQGLGGRGLGDKILLAETDAKHDPLGKENKLVLACGLLAWPQVSSAGRLSAVSKSPLTGGIKEANAGGTFGHALAGIGVQAVILEGKPTEQSQYILEITPDSVSFLPCPELALKGNYHVAGEVQRRFGNRTAALMIGPAGEMELLSAGLTATDLDGDPSRVAARGGLGAVMGSKGIKAIVIKERGRLRPKVKNQPAYQGALQRFHQALQHPFLVNVFTRMGTPSGTALVNKMGALPVRNFSSGAFENVDRILGEVLDELVTSRGGAGKFGVPCMAGCRIRCSSIFPDEEGKEVVRALEFETIGMLGSNLAIADFDQIASLNRLCNDFGLDTIEVGAALGVAAEGGLLQFGDYQQVRQLIEEIGQGTETGRLLGSGAAAVGRAFKVKRVPCVKGQAMGAYDPRGMKGMGVSYATSPQGADHTAGHPGFGGIDHHNPDGQIEVSRNSQLIRTAYDTLGMCAFMYTATSGQPVLFSDLINAVYGTGHGPDYVENLGKEVLAMERAFNRKAGFTSDDDRLPAFFKEEKLPPYDLVFDVSDAGISGLGAFFDG